MVQRKRLIFVRVCAKSRRNKSLVGNPKKDYAIGLKIGVLKEMLLILHGKKLEVEPEPELSEGNEMNIYLQILYSTLCEPAKLKKKIWLPELSENTQALIAARGILLFSRPKN